MAKKPPSSDAKTPSAKDAEGSKLGHRIKRYGQVSSTVAGLAARVAGEKFLGVKVEREKHALNLMASLGALKGPLMKVGQILATIPEALPPEYVEAMQQLQSNAPPMGWPFVRRRMRSELGPDWETQFSTFGKEAAAAASLGQVHKATTLAGVDVACKLQYPDMQSAIAADLSQLRLMFSVYETYDKAIKTTHIFDELKDRLHEELDYIREGKQMQLYGFMLKDEAKSVHVPLYVPELSTPRLLTATWLDGQKILNFKSAPLDVRNQLALNMFRAWYVPLYHYGVIHGDPHLGNYSVRDDLSINLLDFGCVRAFRPAFVEGVINLYRSLLNNDIALSVHAFETWGFTDLNKDQIETLLIWARFLYEPLLDDNKRVIGQTESGIYGRETAKKVHARLREVGRVTVPREFVFMDRAALGLGSVFIHLQAQINWHQLFESMIDGFDKNTLEARQLEAQTRFGLKE